MAEVRKRLDRLWNLVGVFRLGWSNVACSSERPVTLMIIIRADAMVDGRLAQDTATRCHEILLRCVSSTSLLGFGCSVLIQRPFRRGLEDIAVEVAQSATTPCAAWGDHVERQTWYPNNGFEHDFGLDPALGRSIGITGTTSSGTLGGYLRINDQVYALTCHHVAAPDGTSSPSYIHLKLLTHLWMQMHPVLPSFLHRVLSVSRARPPPTKEDGRNGSRKNVAKLSRCEPVWK